MNELIQNCSYLTPQMAKESGVTKFFRLESMMV